MSVRYHGSAPVTRATRKDSVFLVRAVEPWPRCRIRVVGYDRHMAALFAELLDELDGR